MFPDLFDFFFRVPTEQELQGVLSAPCDITLRSPVWSTRLRRGKFLSSDAFQIQLLDLLLQERTLPEFSTDWPRWFHTLRLHEHVASYLLKSSHSAYIRRPYRILERAITLGMPKLVDAFLSVYPTLYTRTDTDKEFLPLQTALQAYLQRFRYHKEMSVVMRERFIQIIKSLRRSESVPFRIRSAHRFHNAKPILIDLIEAPLSSLQPLDLGTKMEEHNECLQILEMSITQTFKIPDL